MAPPPPAPADVRDRWLRHPLVAALAGDALLGPALDAAILFFAFYALRGLI